MKRFSKQIAYLLIGSATLCCAHISYKAFAAHTQRLNPQQPSSPHFADITMEDVTFTLQIKPPLSIDVHAATTTFNVRSTLLVCTTVSCTIKNGTIPIGYVHAPTGEFTVTDKKIHFRETLTILNEQNKILASGADAEFSMQESTISFNKTIAALYDDYTCTAERGSWDLINKKITLDGNVTTCIK